MALSFYGGVGVGHLLSCPRACVSTKGTGFIFYEINPVLFPRASVHVDYGTGETAAGDNPAVGNCAI